MTGRPEDLRLLSDLLGRDANDYLKGRRLVWVRYLGHAIHAWELDERPWENIHVVCVGFSATRDPQGRNYGAAYRDLPRARLAVEILARCERPDDVILAVTEARRTAFHDIWTRILLRECLHGSDLAADPLLLAVLELLAPHWEEGLDALLAVARNGILT